MPPPPASSRLLPLAQLRPAPLTATRTWGRTTRQSQVCFQENQPPAPLLPKTGRTASPRSARDKSNCICEDANVQRRLPMECGLKPLLHQKSVRGDRSQEGHVLQPPRQKQLQLGGLGRPLLGRVPGSARRHQQQQPWPGSSDPAAVHHVVHCSSRCLGRDWHHLGLSTSLHRETCRPGHCETGHAKPGSLAEPDHGRHGPNCTACLTAGPYLLGPAMK
mmetsp:Transcript_85679/g.154252  ORF Transcript_85679/g.154252 Transcript_85679/m.154252 type:complete len:219 (+) Transcript_85679:134-790(+)